MQSPSNSASHTAQGSLPVLALFFGYIQPFVEKSILVFAIHINFL